MNEITLVIIDDHPLFRQGVADILSLEPDIRVIDQAADGEAGLELIRTRRPMVAIVDVNLPGINGQQITQQVALERLSTRIILLTAYHDMEQNLHALRVGAAAYCTKDVEPEELVKIVRAVAGGGYVINGQTYDLLGTERWLASSSDGGSSSLSEAVDLYQALSAREMEVLGYVTKGMSNKEIAALLKISHQTVKNHVTAILQKLGVEDRTQAALYALRRGWVRLHQENTPPEEQ